ncbi:hypothetical protein K445DRAFT_319672 [Daldinia sp. EC12]|nr:hypothetical protein K445DRAFT_319672 [Daldinia sp. EC12]
METPLQTPNPPVNMLDGYVSQEQVMLTMYCHDSSFKSVTVLDGEGNPIFRVEGTTFGTSWSWRRRVWDSKKDCRIYDFRHNSLDIKNGWVVETPEGRKLCSLQHQSQVTRNHSSVDATVRTEAGEDVLVLMRPNGMAAITTTITVGDATIATIHKVEDNLPGSRGGRERSVWAVRIAPGVDMSLIMVMALCRAEMGHVWKQ